LVGKIVAVEGVEGSGRTLHAEGIRTYLEEQGYGVITFGLGMSKLLGEAIARKKRDVVFQRRTLFLAYVTDLADQVENLVKPAVESGFVALADGYVLTLMAWGLTRGLERNWMEGVLRALPRPELTLALIAPPEEIMKRIIRKKGVLDPLSSGVDLCVNGDLYQGFRQYLERYLNNMRSLASDKGGVTVDTGRDFKVVQEEINSLVGGDLSEA